MDKRVNCDWNTYKELLKERDKEILSELKDVKKTVQKIDKRLVKVEVKSGLWGVIGGAIPFLLYYLKTSLK